jgi:hypothetical protein
MKSLLFVLFCFTLFSCSNCNPVVQPKEEKAHLAREVKPSLAAFTDTLKKLHREAPATIDHAVRLYGLLAPYDSTGADSAAAALMGFVEEVVARENERLLHDTTNYTALLHPSDSNLTEKQKAVSSEMRQNKLKPVSDGEGGVYLVPFYETILPGIKDKTSAPLDNYLDLAAKEDTTPVFRDAGLAIEMPELADRLVLSEHLLAQKLPRRFEAAVARLNRFYTNALINGADNSPAIEYNSTTLNEEFKKGYDYLLAKYPSTKAAAKVNVWMAVVASGDKRKMDDFRKTVQ